MIKILKINELICQNFEKKTVDENGNIVWNIPTDLNEFKTLAIDTINWQVGDNVKKSLGNTQTLLSASNAKAITLLAKLISTFNPDTTVLTALELDSFNKMISLANSGYSDSELLNNSLTSVSDFIAAGSDKVARVSSAVSIDEVIAILNE